VKTGQKSAVLLQHANSVNKVVDVCRARNVETRKTFTFAFICNHFTSLHFTTAFSALLDPPIAAAPLFTLPSVIGAFP
jgi:hypothetical protein